MNIMQPNNFENSYGIGQLIDILIGWSRRTKLNTRLTMVEDDISKDTHRDDFIPPETPDVMLGNPVLDNVMSTVIALGSEFWALQRRMNIVETLLEKNGSVSHEMIESYRPTEEQTAAWDIQRDRFIKRTYGFLQNTHPDKVSGT